MTAPLVIRVKDRDNVAIAVHDLETDVEVMPGVVTRDPIPQAHKVALVDIPKGGEIIRYGGCPRLCQGRHCLRQLDQ